MPKSSTIDSYSAELETLEPNSKTAPVSRLNNAAKALAIYERLREEDKESAHNRSRIQAMMDGEPPYSRQELLSAGQGFRTNQNFGEAESALDDALSAYIDLHHSAEMLLSVRTTFGDDAQQRAKWNETLSRGITNLLRSWPAFTSTTLKNVGYFLTHGVSLCYFQDETNWQWRTARFGDFLIPRRTEANVGAIEIAFCRREMSPSEIWRYIRNEKAATKAGWNVPLVKEALVRSANSARSAHPLDDYERWQEKSKDCDLYMDVVSNNLAIIHCWVQEFGGRVSHFIIQEDEPNNARLNELGDDGFLFKKLGRFESMDRVFVPFTYGTGNTGNFHGIRGLGYKIFPHIQVSNRLHCQLADGAMLSSSMIVQPEKQFGKETLGMTYFGPYAVMSPDLKHVQMTPPNYGQNVIPALNEFDRLKRLRAGQYSPANVLPERGEMTRAEVNSRVSQAAQLSAVNQFLYYEPNDWLYKEVVQRLKKPGYSIDVPGGAAVRKLLEYLEREDCPIEALQKIDLDTVRSTRAIGGGSKATRDNTYDRLMGVAGSFDPTGRQRLIRDQTASLLGDYSLVDRYLPEPEDARVSMETKIAELENAAMADLRQMMVRPNDLHLDHLAEHIRKLSEYSGAVDQGAPLEQVVQPMVLIHEHAALHLEMVQGDLVSEEQVALFRQGLQQFGEIIINGTRRLQKLAREGKAAAGNGSVEAGKNAELNDRLERQVQEQQLKLKFQQEKHELEMQNRAQKAELEMKLADARAASQILQKY